MPSSVTSLARSRRYGTVGSRGFSRTERLPSKLKPAPMSRPNRNASSMRRIRVDSSEGRLVPKSALADVFVTKRNWRRFYYAC